MLNLHLKKKKKKWAWDCRDEISQECRACCNVFMFVECLPIKVCTLTRESNESNGGSLSSPSLSTLWQAALLRHEKTRLTRSSYPSNMKSRGTVFLGRDVPKFGIFGPATWQRFNYCEKGISMLSWSACAMKVSVWDTEYFGVSYDQQACLILTWGELSVSTSTFFIAPLISNQINQKLSRPGTLPWDTNREETRALVLEFKLNCSNEKTAKYISSGKWQKIGFVFFLNIFFFLSMFRIVLKVADLQRQLSTANERSAGLEKRQGLLEKELVDVEGGAVRSDFIALRGDDCINHTEQIKCPQ